MSKKNGLRARVSLGRTNDITPPPPKIQYISPRQVDADFWASLRTTLGIYHPKRFFLIVDHIAGTDPIAGWDQLEALEKLLNPSRLMDNIRLILVQPKGRRYSLIAVDGADTWAAADYYRKRILIRIASILPELSERGDREKAALLLRARILDGKQLFQKNPAEEKHSGVLRTAAKLSPEVS
jgi:hypothetical protein